MRRMEISMDLFKIAPPLYMVHQKLNFRRMDSSLRVEVTTGGRRTNDDGERDSYGKPPSNLEDASECRNADGARAIDRKRRDGGDSRKNVKEDTGSFGHAFAQYSRSLVLEVQFSLRHWLRWDLRTKRCC